jgi:hypothetical protein
MEVLSTDQPQGSRRTMTHGAHLWRQMAIVSRFADAV